MRFTIVLALLGGCAFDFSRGDQLRPGEVHGTAVGADGAPLAHVRATVEGLPTPARADGAGGFRVVLGAGVFVLRVVEDKDGDGRAERGALRGVTIRRADIDGESRLTGVELGNVTLLGTGAVRGAVEDETGAPVEAEVVVIRTSEGLGDGGAFVISGDAARTLPAEARVRARVDGAQSGFAADGLVPGSVFVVALATDAEGAVLVSEPRLVDVPSEGVADAGAVVVRPPPSPTVDVTLELTSAVPAEDGELVDVVLSAAGVDTPAGAAPVNGAQLLSAVPVGRYDVRATSTLRPDELGGALDGQLALSLEDPTNANAPVLWGPLVLVEGALCGALADRDGDGLPALPSPSVDVAAWIACASTCAAAFGTEGAAASCPIGSESAEFDCDDDGDLQPDVTEPFDCVSLCASTDLDGDGACDDVDDDPRCAIVDDALVCIGDAGYVRPGVRPEYLPAEGEGEGEGEGEPCLVDTDCAPVLDVIALCDQPAGTCAPTGVPVPSAPATTFFHGSGGWGVVASPPARRDHAMASIVSAATTFDVVMFGGLTASGHTNELFGWDAVDATWTAIDAEGPAPRGRAAFAYDSGTDSVLLVGGEKLSVVDGATVVTTFTDVWELDLVTLTWIDRGVLAGAEPGSALVADRDAAAVPSLVYLRPSGAQVLRFDAVDGFTAVTELGARPAFDGDVVGALLADDTPLFFFGARAALLGTTLATHFLLDSVGDTDTQWLESAPANGLFPAARTGAAIAASPSGVHVFGGDLLDDDAPLAGASARSNELWLFDGDSWTLDIAGGDVPGTLPPPRSGAKMAFDGTHVVIVGGDESIDDDAAAALHLSEVGQPTWSRMPALPVEPKRREAAFAFATDGGIRDEVVVIGGRTADDAFLDDTWIFSRATFTWREVDPLPSPRGASAAVHDRVRDVIVLFGGEAAGDQVLGDLLELDMTTGTWTTRVDVVGLPSARKRHGMAYDPTENDVVIAGGNDGVGVLADTFRYDGTSSAARGTLPTAREVPVMTTNLAAGGGGIGLYGGRDGGGAVLGDACELDPTTDSWSCFTITGIDAGPREAPGYVFDETTGFLVLFGGRDSNGDDRNDLWQIADIADGLATPLAATFVLPAPRKGPVFVWDEQGLFLLGSAP